MAENTVVSVDRVTKAPASAIFAGAASSAAAHPARPARSASSSSGARSPSRRPWQCPRRSSARARAPSPGRDRRHLGGEDSPRPQRVHAHPVPLPGLRPGLGGAGRHHGGRQAPPGVGAPPRTPRSAAEIVELPGRTPVLLIDNGGSGDPVVVYGHMDKQPPLGEWRSGLGPYEPVREGDLLYGRGTADDGYATFAAVTGLLAAGGGRGRVLILIEASEESGSPDLLAHLEHLKERIGKPRLVICLDSGGLSYDRLWLTSSLRGNLVATVRVDVLTEGIHSGQGGGVVPSSFRILRRILSGIEDEATGRILLPELQGAGIPEAQHANLEVVAAEFPDSTAPVVDGLRLLAPDPLDRLIARTWGAALEVTGADGLPKPRGRRQRPASVDDAEVQPAPAAPTWTREVATDALISAIRSDEGAHITIDLEAAAQGWVAPPLSPGVAATLSAVSKERFGRAPGFVGEGGSIPFLADLQKGFPGTQFVATGVLGPHSNAHGPTSRSTSRWPRPSPRPSPRCCRGMDEQRGDRRADPGEARPAGRQGCPRHRGQPRPRTGNGARLRRCRSRRRRHQPQVRRLPGGGGRGGGEGAAGPARGLPRGALGRDRRTGRAGLRHLSAGWTCSSTTPACRRSTPTWRRSARSCGTRCSAST